MLILMSLSAYLSNTFPKNPGSSLIEFHISSKIPCEQKLWLRKEM